MRTRLLFARPRGPAEPRAASLSSVASGSVSVEACDLNDLRFFRNAPGDTPPLAPPLGSGARISDVDSYGYYA